jgi:DNA polymerase I-like protein with 3'-5' exonuclease and polymerase domains
MPNRYCLPSSFPDLSRAKVISIDVETRDDDLEKKGPGVRRGADIIGVSIAADHDFCEYYPVAHDGGPNLNKKAVFRWLKGELNRASQVKLGANLLYDFDFLAEQSVQVKGPWYDVQIAEPLLDENNAGNYNLGALAKKYLGKAKEETELETYCAERGWKDKVQKHLWEIPPELVARYAKQDVRLPIEIFEKQMPILKTEELWDLFLLEIRLSPLLLQMRRTGIRINVTKLNHAIIEYKEYLRQTYAKLKKFVGFEINYQAGESIARAFDKLEIEYPLTPKTRKPSFIKEWLKAHEHPLAQLITSCRTLDKFIGTFLEGSIKNQLINGRVHCLFNQLLSDEYGTVTGRFSCSHPNLQFIPARDEKLGPLCRSMFIPEKGYSLGKADYSQVEFRIFAHYAIGSGADHFRAEYVQNPRIDYHQWCADKTNKPRRKAKDINFGLIYGMGLKKLAKQLGLPYTEAEKFLQEYNEKIPFMKTTLQAASNAALSKGYVKTILNRRRRFNTWAPVDYALAKELGDVEDKSLMMKQVSKKIKEAFDKTEISPRPGVQRAYTYRALNAIIQGSAADLIKKAMVDIWEAGLCDILIPHLTVHDELISSVPKTKEGKEAFEEMIHLMETAIKFKVPIIVDHVLAKNWGEVE